MRLNNEKGKKITIEEFLSVVREEIIRVLPNGEITFYWGGCNG